MPLELTDLDNAPIIKTLTIQLGEVGKLVRGMVAIQAQQTSAIRELTTKQAAAVTDKSGVDEKDENDDIDVNSLDNGAFQKLIMKEIGGMLDERLGQFGQKLDGVTTEFRTGKLREEYDKIKKDHPDFDDWSDEMKALAKTNPGLSLKQLYNLVRSEDTKKAKELDEKYVKADDKGKPDTGLTMFGGFRPTIGKTGGGDAGKGGEKLDAAKAGEKAWEETVSRYPGLASLETNPLD